ncbi:CTTNBP2 N-terminal-like protein [Anopheles ziemanni]|uniref:CTTNBP2 N-terminal-like protein n=1 Tax=Anopheles ziemanni TaxID=345580 RepID=UPI0026580FF7|nr:CTTNBP2 N-terminal-like protein isoform X2 [Anopheles coustani]XP_058171427.1 CTTNBP2 N-terminal-like protein [Anopheles ziemanni]
MAEVGTSSSGDGESAAPDKPKGTVKFTDADLAAIKQTSDTWKRNPKMDFSKADLLKLLSYLEGELQARDVVIAVLKTEKIKQLLTTPRYSKSTNLNDPHAALFRDQLAASGNIASRQSSFQAAHSEHEMRLINDQRSSVREQMDSLAALVMQQRQAQAKMIEALKDAEERHKRVVQELYDERRKHEHTTAQGDDITYGLEIERSRLKQELDHEKEQHKALEIELRKVQEQFEAEKNRQKQIVLLLLAERKKIIIKYIEERKRSEDLAQILSEEKQRVDTIAEGLEEESKKSLRMEAELEKQAQVFEVERKMLHQSLAKEEKRVKEQEIEIQQLKAEIDLLRKQTGIRHPLVAPQLPTKPGGLVPSRPSIAGGLVGGIPSGGNATGTPGIVTTVGSTTAAGSIGIAGVLPGQMISSMATKVVQPTATVSSVPVSAPTTGIARSVSPGQLIRQTAISQLSVTAPPTVGGNSSPVAPAGTGGSPAGAIPSETYANTTGKMASTGVRKAAGIAAATVIAGGAGTGATSPAAATNSSAMSGSTATMKKTIIPPVGGRGVPPPIPPNKPQIPPKLSGVSAVAAVAAGAVSSRIPFLSNSGSSSSSSSGSSTGSLGSSNTTPVSPVSSSISSSALSSTATASSLINASAMSSSNNVASISNNSSNSISSINSNSVLPPPSSIFSSSCAPGINANATPIQSTTPGNNAGPIAPNASHHHPFLVSHLYTNHPHAHPQSHAHPSTGSSGGVASALSPSANNVIASSTAGSAVVGAKSVATTSPAAATVSAAAGSIAAPTATTIPSQPQSVTPTASSATPVSSAPPGGPSEILTNVGCEGGLA